MYPLGPIIEGVGVNVTVFSYLDAMYVGVQGCWDLVPDVEVIARGMEDVAGRAGGAGQPPGPARFPGGTPNSLRRRGFRGRVDGVSGLGPCPMPVRSEVRVGSGSPGRSAARV